MHQNRDILYRQMLADDGAFRIEEHDLRRGPYVIMVVNRLVILIRYVDPFHSILLDEVFPNAFDGMKVNLATGTGTQTSAGTVGAL